MATRSVQNYINQLALEARNITEQGGGGPSLPFDASPGQSPTPGPGSLGGGRFNYKPGTGLWPWLYNFGQAWWNDPDFWSYGDEIIPDISRLKPLEVETDDLPDRENAPGFPQIPVVREPPPLK